MSEPRPPTPSAPTSPSPPPKQFTPVQSAFVIALFVPAMFYMSFGPEAMGMATGLTVFLLVIVLVPLLVQRATPAVERDRSPHRDMGTIGLVIGVVWLLSSSLGVLLGWLATKTPDMTADGYRLWLWVRLVLAGILPLTSCLLMLPGVRGGLTGIALLFGLTCLPVVSTFGAVTDLVRGPVERDGKLYLRGVGRWVTPPGAPTRPASRR